MNYIDAIKKVIQHEGGSTVTNIKQDRGGLTKFGISKAAYPNLDIANLTEAEAIQIYKKDYWDKIGGDSIKFYSVAFALFDQAVNRGVSTALKQAQSVLGLTPTGRLDQSLISSLNAFSEAKFLDAFLQKSKEAYQAIVSANPAQSVFLKGWLNRVSSLEKYSKQVLGNINSKSVGVGVVLIAAFFLIYFLVKKGKKK